MNYETEINNLFEELVPVSGKAESMAGELVRAACRIGYRFLNDGDRIGIGYGKETCNPAARYLLANGSDDVQFAVCHLWDAGNDDEYEKIINDELCKAVINQIEKNPELKKTPTGDMWDYATDEDVDDEDWDDEE